VNVGVLGSTRGDGGPGCVDLQRGGEVEVNRPGEGVDRRRPLAHREDRTGPRLSAIPQVAGSTTVVGGDVVGGAVVGGGAVVVVVVGGGTVVGGGGVVVAGGRVVVGAGGRAVRVVVGAGSLVGGTDVDVGSDVAGAVVGVVACVVAGSRSICSPRTRTGWRAGSSNGPTWARSAVTTAVHAPSTHQNHRPSRSTPMPSEQ